LGAYQIPNKETTLAETCKMDKLNTFSDSNEKTETTHGSMRALFARYGWTIAVFLLLWLVKGVETIWNLDFMRWGIYPLTAEGALGILLAPLIHSDFNHLVNNAFSILVLGGLISYFYPTLFLKVLVIGWITTGFWVWVFARDAWHIGASGVVYSLASFLFVSGLIRKNPHLLAVTLLVAFLYGGLTWGVFPVQQQISWESHLMGLISGLVLAVFFRNQGPKPKVYLWEDESDKDELDNSSDSEYSVPFQIVEPDESEEPDGLRKPKD